MNERKKCTALFALFALWRGKCRKCRKCKAKNDSANFYTTGIRCRGKEERAGFNPAELPRKKNLRKKKCLLGLLSRQEFR